MLCGNDALPYTMEEFLLCICGCLLGCFVNSYIFGNLLVMVQGMNRKMQAFQEKLDLTCTTMRNMHLGTALQTKVMKFLTMTQSTLDHQKDLEQFYSMLSPSLGRQVTHFMFEH